MRASLRLKGSAADDDIAGPKHQPFGRPSFGRGVALSMDARAIDSVILSFGSTVLNPNAWTPALEGLSALLGGVATSLELANMRTGDMRFECPLELDEAVRQEYEQHIFSVNPRIAAGQKASIGALIDDRCVTGLREAHEYLTWLENTPSRYFQGAKVIERGGEVGYIGTHYGRFLGEDDASVNEQVYNRIMPHIVNALSMARMVNESAVTSACLNDARLASAASFLLLDRKGHVTTCSLGCEAILAPSSVLQISRNRLVALRASDRAALDRFMGQLLGPGLMSPKPIRLCAEPHMRGVALRGVRLMPSDDIFGIFRPVGMVAIRDLDAPLTSARDEITELFSLTLREADVTVGIAMGKSPEHISAELKISLETVRQHLKSVFRKTHTSRQSELTYLCAALLQ